MKRPIILDGGMAIGVASALMLAGYEIKRRKRHALIEEPTPAQKARQEREDWNRAVEERKAARRAAKSRPATTDSEG